MELNALFIFLEKHSVSSLTDDIEISVQIHKKRKPASEKPMAVLVHGWSGDSETFGNMPEYLSAKVNCDVEIYPYSTALFGHSPSTLTIARNLDNWIRIKAEGRVLALIAHSMGGLVVRRLITMQKEVPDGFDCLVKHVTFIASPHNGAALASIGKKIPFLKSMQLEELSPSSPVLFELNSQWDRWMRSNVPAKCSVRSIVGTADDVVSINDARGLDPEAVPILGAGHIDIVKPRQPDDEVVLTLARFLWASGFSRVG